MAQDKKSFILYADLVHTVRKMPKAKRADLFMTILEYVNDENPEVSDLVVSLVWEPIKLQLKRDLSKYENIRSKKSEAGTKGMKSRWNPPVNDITNDNTVIKPITNITDTVNDTVNVNDNVTVNDIDIPKEGEISVDDCLVIAMKDEKWMRLNKTDKSELLAFNFYLEKLGINYKVPIDYKVYFSRLKTKKPEVLVKHYTIDELKELAKQMDAK